MSTVQKVFLFIAIGSVSLGIVITALALCGVWGDVFANADTVPKTMVSEKEFKNIVIYDLSGDIEIVYSDSDELRIDYTDTASAPHNIVFSDDTLKITVEHKIFQFFYRGKTYVKLYLPRGTSYSVITLETVSGNITFPSTEPISCESITATTTSGNIKISSIDCKENANFKTTSGIIELSSIRGSAVFAKATSGSVTASCIDNDCFSAETVSGKVNLISVKSKELKCKCISGDIGFTDCDGEKIYFKTTSGDIKGNLLTPKNFDTKTTSGKCDHPHHAQTNGDCHAETTSGDIDIKVNE